MGFSETPLQSRTATHLACEVGGSWGVGEHTPFGVVRGHVPGGACCGVKVIVPVLVKSVVGVFYCVDQSIVEHLGWSCNTEETPLVDELSHHATHDVMMLLWCDITYALAAGSVQYVASHATVPLQRLNT